jgi:hypothetical protein
MNWQEMIELKKIFKARKTQKALQVENEKEQLRMIMIKEKTTFYV